MKETYLEAVETIKAAILKSQSRTVRNTNREVLFLYYSIGGYVSGNSREGTWGTGAIDEISARLREELPGLRGFSGRNIKSMRQFYEAWRPYLQVSQPLEPRGKPAAAAADLVLEAEAGPGNRPPLAADLVLEAEAGPGNRPPLAADLALEAEAGPGNRPPLAAGLVLEAEAGPGNRPPLAADLVLTAAADFTMEDFTGISFSHHMEILHTVEDVAERMFYIRASARCHWSKYALRERLKQDLYHHQGALPNNFSVAIPDDKQYMRAIRMFKDEYFLDFINTEELDLSDPQDMDERLLEHEIIGHIRDFIQCLGPGFCFVGNQHRIEVDGEEFFADLLFFQRDLKALVVIELKKGKFKPAYLGQLNFYLSALDRQERKNGENPSIGILLCREANKSVVELAIRDYTKPLGVATYRTADELPEDYRVLTPIMEEAPRLLDHVSSEGGGGAE